MKTMSRLTELREEKGLNKKKVAAEMGLAYTTYVGYENGTRKLSGDKLKKFAEYYGVTTDYILGVTDEKNPAAGSDEIDVSSDGTDMDELEYYAQALFRKLNIEGKIDAITRLKSLLQQQESRDDLK